MTDGDDERIAHLAGEGAQSLPRAQRHDLDELRALLRSPEMWEEPDAALEDRVVAAIEREATARARRPTARGGSWASRVRGALHRPGYRLGAIAGAVAAASVAAVAVVATTTTGGNGSAPLQFAMVVTGTPLAPGAHGSATLVKTASGWRTRLTASGLPHLASGRYYEAWLKNAAGILVPVGTFNDARSVTLWSGVPVTQYRALTVTQQRADGDPAWSGRRVLTGTIRRSR